MVRVRQRFPHEREEVEAAIARELARVGDRITAGMRVCIGVGSRGITALDTIVRAVVAAVRARGAQPFVTPAMGAHGGATPDGQRRLLESFGISEAKIGCPIESSMDVVELGVADGVPVYFSRLAREADLTIPINRVRRHSGFRGRLESGLCKMLGLGFGNQRGAQAIHAHGFARVAGLIPEVAKVILERANIGFGIALLENADDTTARIEAVPREAFLEREPELLALAIRLMPQIRIPDFDLLVVDELGKDISEAGMDANVTGRSVAGLVKAEVRYRTLAALHLSTGTRGNATGMGFADVVSQSLVDAIDWRVTYTNCATAGAVHPARLPVVMATDRDAIALGMALALRPGQPAPRIVRIASTKRLEVIAVSEDLAASLAVPGVEVIGAPEAWEFSTAGHVLPIGTEPT
jgi:hypothetical protein